MVGPVDRGPESETDEPPDHKPRPRRPEEGPRGRQSRDAECAVGGTQETFGAGLDERGDGDGELANSEPANTSRHVVGHAHAGDGLDGQIAQDEAVVAHPAREAREARQFGFPQEVADEVVLADVAGKVVDPCPGVDRRGAPGRPRRIFNLCALGGQVVEMRTAEHV